MYAVNIVILGIALLVSQINPAMPATNMDKKVPLLKNQPDCPTFCTCRDYNSGGIITLIECRRISLTSFPVNLEEHWPSLEILSLPYNKLKYLRPDIMPNLPNLTALHLQNNNIASIAKGTFDKYPKLERLELSSNYFAVDNNMTSLRNVLCGLSQTSITHLYLHRITHDQRLTVNNRTFQCLGKTNLTYLDFSYNHIPDFLDGLFSPMKTLQYLDLRKTVESLVLNMTAFQGLNLLDSLLLQLNPINTFPVFLNADNSTILPNLKKLHLDFSRIEWIRPDSLRGLDSLIILTLDWNNQGIKYLQKENFINLPSLKYLNMAHNHFEHIDEGAFSHPTIDTLDFTGSTFTLNPIADSLLLNLPNLKKLRFSEIYSLYGGTKTLSKLFRNLTNLEHIELANLNLENVGSKLFKNNKKLTHINLSGNSIQEIHPDLFSHLNELKELYLGNNKILSVIDVTFPPHVLNSLLILDLSYNPYDCSCNSMHWFLETWMKQPWNNHSMGDKLHMDKNANSYACSTPKKFQNQFLGDISLKDCLNAPISLEFILVLLISASSCMVFLIFSLVYRYQWHFKYWCFNLKAKWTDQHPTPAPNEIYKYDAFVSYCSSEIKWVKTYLLEFERKNGFTFCLHERDWLAGPDIVTNIMQSINQSRKIILVVSNAFARSQWCYFEMTLIQVELLKQDKDNVILIVKEQIDDINMNPRLAWHMKTKTYIEWPLANQQYQQREDLLSSMGLEFFQSDTGEETVPFHPSRINMQASLGLPGTHKAIKLFWEKLDKVFHQPSHSFRSQPA